MTWGERMTWREAFDMALWFAVSSGRRYRVRRVVGWGGERSWIMEETGETWR